MRVLRSVQRHTQRFLALPRQERTLVLHAYVSLLRTDVELRLCGYKRVLTSIESRSSPRPGRPCADSVDRSIREAWALDVASRHHIIHARCLHRSLTLHRWIRRRCEESQLRIGVVKLQGQLKAHAWVEVGGNAIGDSSATIAGFHVLKPLLTATKRDPRDDSSAPEISDRGIQWL